MGTIVFTYSGGGLVPKAPQPPQSAYAPFLSNLSD